MKDLRLNSNYFMHRIQHDDEIIQKNSVNKIGGETMKKVANDVGTIDLRNAIEFSFEEIDSDEFDDVIENMYEIVATLNGEEVGFMNFSVTYGKEDESLNNMLIKLVEVNNNMQGLGIGQLLYKEFGQIYSRDFGNVPISRFFINPVAEYAFRKAVSLGWVPDSALDENRVKRDYSEQDDQLWTDLRQKLPEPYRGKAAKDLRRKVVS